VPHVTLRPLQHRESNTLLLATDNTQVHAACVSKVTP
jgi:hypothetical protein